MTLSDASKAGLWRSTNGGASWSQYPESTFGNCDLLGGITAPCPADSVIIDPLNQQNVYVGIDSNTVYYSNDGGATFKAAVFPGGHISQGRHSLASGPKVPAPIGPSANPPGGAVYAMIGSSDGVEFVNMFETFD